MERNWKPCRVQINLFSPCVWRKKLPWRGSWSANTMACFPCLAYNIPDLLTAERQSSTVLFTMSFHKNAMSHPLLVLALNLFDEHQFSSKDNMVFGQSGGIRNTILFMLDTCIIFLNIQSWVYAGLQQSLYYLYKITTCHVIMFRLVIMQPIKLMWREIGNFS